MRSAASVCQLADFRLRDIFGEIESRIRTDCAAGGASSCPFGEPSPDDRDQGKDDDYGGRDVSEARVDGRRLGLGIEGVLDSDLPSAGAPTVYSRVGDWPAAMIVAIALIFVIGRRFANSKL